MSRYPDKAPPNVCPIVNAPTKVTIPGREHPVLFILNYATLVGDDQCIKILTTEPHSPWQIPEVNAIGRLGSMVQNTMRRFNIPMKKHDWVKT
jgi:hypothetical protein